MIRSTATVSPVRRAAQSDPVDRDRQRQSQRQRAGLALPQGHPTRRRRPLVPRPRGLLGSRHRDGDQIVTASDQLPDRVQIPHDTVRARANTYYRPLVRGGPYRRWAGQEPGSFPRASRSLARSATACGRDRSRTNVCHRRRSMSRPAGYSPRPTTESSPEAHPRGLPTESSIRPQPGTAAGESAWVIGGHMHWAGGGKVHG